MVVDLARTFAGVQSPVDKLQEGIAFGQQQADRQAAIEAQAAAQEQQQIMNKELFDFSRNETRTADDYRDMIARYPQLADKFKASMEQMDEETKANTITEATGIYAALRSGNVETATTILERKKQAAINSGDKQAETQADIMLQAIKSDPQAATAMAGLFLSTAQGEKFTDTIAGIEAQATAAIMDPVNLAAKLADIGKTKAETAKILKEVAAGEKAGSRFMTPQELKAQGFAEGTIAQIDGDGVAKILVEPEGSAGEKALTDIGKLNQDLADGKITQDQFDLKVQKTLGLSGETAFKAAGVVQASEALPELEKLLFKDGDLREANLIFDPSVPFTEETKNLNTLFRSAAWAMLRGESGAVINQSEVDEAYNTYFPTVFDTDKSAALKFEQFKKRINNARTFLLPELEGKQGPLVETLLNKYAPEGT